MKTKSLVWILVAALLAGGLVATTVYAADKADSPTGASAHGRLLQRLATKLNLTADQRAQIKAVIAGERPALAPLLTSVRDARINLRSAIRASAATEVSVRAASATVAAAEADLAVERMKLYGKIAPILTDAQRRQLAGLQQRADELVDAAIARVGSGLDD